MGDTSAGFKFRFRMSGAPPTIQEFVVADAETITAGDLVTLASGEIDLAASDDVGILGVALETKACNGTTDKIKCIVDADAVYGVYDANARVKGAILDITGTTGAMTVAADSDHDVVVYAPSAADEETLVYIIHGSHPDTIAKT